MALAKGAGKMPVDVHAVFTRKQGDAVSQADIAQSPVRSHQLRRLIPPVGILSGMVLNIRPAEIVHATDFIKFAADGQHASHRFIDGGRDHVIGVNH